MPKLHELLAVGPNLRGQAEATRTDLKNTFEKKTTHFTEKKVTFKSVNENIPDKTEQHQVLQTTIAKELAWITEKLSAAIDCGHRIDVANTYARADIALDDGTVILTGVPATSLLQLEHRLTEIQDLVNAIPTLDPAKGFQQDANYGKGVYKALDVEKPRTEKKFDFIVMVPPTDKFPAQVKELSADTVVGHTLTQEWSALITVAEKGKMLDRIENLARAVKQARSRANDTHVDSTDKNFAIGEKLLNFVFNGA